MKKIPEPDLSDAQALTPPDMNKIHFGGNHTPLTPEKLKKLAKETGKSPTSQAD